MLNRILTTIFLLIISSAGVSAARMRHVTQNDVISNMVTVREDNPILLTGGQIMTIDSMDFTMHNDITLRDNATLIITNSTFNYIHDYSYQYKLRAYNDARVVIMNSTVTSSKWLNWQFFNSSTLEITGVTNPESYVWHGFQNTASAIIRGASKFQGTLNHSTRVHIENTPMTFIETVFPLKAIVDEAFPVKVGNKQYIFPNARDTGVTTRITLKNTGSTYSKWAITYGPTNAVILRNTSKLTVTFSMPATYSGMNIQFTNLRPGYYADETWSTGDAKLRLIKSTVVSWSPIVSGANTLTVLDSILADNAFSFGTAQVYVYRTTMSLVKSNDQVKMYLYDSAVTGDVIATEDSIIVLSNTTVGGQMVQKDNGQIIVLP